MFESNPRRVTRAARASLLLVACCATSTATLGQPTDPVGLDDVATTSLVDWLHAEEPARRAAALAELARRGPGAAEAVDPLRTLTDQGSMDERILVGRALWRIAGDSGPLVVACRAALADSDDALRLRAAGQLSDVGPEAIHAVPRLRSLLDSRHELLAVQAAEAIARISPADPAAADLLARVLDGGSETNRTQAAYASAELAPLHWPLVVPSLERAAASESASVRSAATLVLAEMRHSGRAESQGWRPTGATALPVATTAPSRADEREAEPPARIAAAPAASAAPVPLTDWLERPRPPAASPASSPPVSATADSGPAEGQPVSVPEPVAVSHPVDAAYPVAAAGSTPLDPRPSTLDPPLASVEMAMADDTPLVEPQPLVAPPDEERFYRAKPLTAIEADITIADAELREFARERYDESAARTYVLEEGCYLHALGTTRPWVMSACYWEATAFAHEPLYFENPCSERYGIKHGDFVQVGIEAGRFYGSALLIPYMIGAMPPHECVYTLGYYRPGECIPCQYQGTIRRGWSDPCIRKATLRGAAYQAAAVVGLIYIVP